MEAEMKFNRVMVLGVAILVIVPTPGFAGPKGERSS
jgi:hypothetical protein